MKRSKVLDGVRDALAWTHGDLSRGRLIVGGCRIDIAKVGSTDLLVATSPDLAGLMVHGRSTADIARRAPIAIADLRAAANGAST